MEKIIVTVCIILTAVIMYFLLRERQNDDNKDLVLNRNLREADALIAFAANGGGGWVTQLSLRESEITALQLSVRSVQLYIAHIIEILLDSDVSPEKHGGIIAVDGRVPWKIWIITPCQISAQELRGACISSMNNAMTVDILQKKISPTWRTLTDARRVFVEDENKILFS